MMHIASVRANRYFLSSNAKLGRAERYTLRPSWRHSTRILYNGLSTSFPVSSHVLVAISYVPRILCQPLYLYKWLLLSWSDVDLAFRGVLIVYLVQAGVQLGLV